MNVRQIDAREAVVKTAVVEVKTLTVSGKQVTLAVFRQLMEEPIIGDLDGETELPTLSGQPWGVVNYHPDKCDGTDRHLHVVWQKNNQLRRSLVRFRLPEWSEDWQDAVEDIRYLAVLRRIAESGIGTIKDQVRGYRWAVASPPLSTSIADTHRQDAVSKFIRSFKHPAYEGARYYEAYSGGLSFNDPADLRAHVLEGAERVAGSNSSGLSSAATWELANRDQGDLFKARAEYRALYDQLDALDQLFIAV